MAWPTRRRMTVRIVNKTAVLTPFIFLFSNLSLQMTILT